MKSIQLKQRARIDLGSSAAGEEDPGAAVDAPAAPGPVSQVLHTASMPGSVPLDPAEEHVQLHQERDRGLRAQRRVRDVPGPGGRASEEPAPRPPTSGRT